MQIPKIKSITSVETSDRQSLNNIQSHSSHRNKLDNKINQATNSIRNRKQKLILAIQNVQKHQQNVVLINQPTPQNPNMGCDLLPNKFEERVNRQKNIADLTAQENKNLREQNEYLLGQLRKMQMKYPKMKKIKQNASKYKQLYESAQYELELKRMECQVYKNKADLIRRLTDIDMERLENQIIPFMKESQVTNHTDPEDHFKENLYQDD